MVNVDTHILVFALTGEVTNRERRVLASRACPQIQAELVRKFWLPEGPARAAAGWMQGNGASEVP